MPTATKRRLTSAARKRGMSLSRFLVEAAKRDAEGVPESLPVSETALEIMRFVRPENTIPEDL